MDGGDGPLRAPMASADAASPAAGRRPGVRPGRRLGQPARLVRPTWGSEHIETFFRAAVGDPYEPENDQVHADKVFVLQVGVLRAAGAIASDGTAPDVIGDRLLLCLWDLVDGRSIWIELQTNGEYTIPHEAKFLTAGNDPNWMNRSCQGAFGDIEGRCRTRCKRRRGAPGKGVDEGSSPSGEGRSGRSAHCGRYCTRDTIPANLQLYAHRQRCDTVPD